jgi:hypothetical protein
MHEIGADVPSIGADNANEQIGPGIRMGDSTVMLSRSEASRYPARETFRCRSG